LAGGLEPPDEKLVSPDFDDAVANFDHRLRRGIGGRIAV
jgi:hypothetical protein